MGRYSRPIGRLSPCAANGVRVLLVTITFLGEQQDIFDPGAAVPVAGRRRNANGLFVTSQSTTRQVEGHHLL